MNKLKKIESKKKYKKPQIKEKTIRFNFFYDSRFFNSFDIMIVPPVFATSHEFVGCTPCPPPCSL